MAVDEDEQRIRLEDRMAQLAGRLVDEDEDERRYASLWLDKLWHLRDAVYPR